MSTDDPNDGQEDRVVQMNRKDIRALEKRAKAAEDAEARAVAAERRLAFREAGIPATGIGQLFEKAYDATDFSVDAIRASAEEYGILDAQSPQPGPGELAAHQRMANASQGSSPAGRTDILAEVQAAKNEPEIMALVAKYPKELGGINLRNYG